MKFLVPNCSCLQNPWLGGYRPQIPVLSVLCPQMNLLNLALPRTKFLGTPLLQTSPHSSLILASCIAVLLPTAAFRLYWLSGAAFEGGKWGDRPRPRSWGGPALQAYEFVKLYSPVNWKCWYKLRLKSFFKVKFLSVVLGCLLFRNLHNQCLR